jgi:dimethylhistidine N-methyltransferase
MAGQAAPGVSREALAREVQYYLTQVPRQLPSYLLYDALGSALFEAIGELPWYTPTRAEARLLARHARAILAGAARVSTIVELGAGSGAKLSILLEAAGGGAIDVHLIDVSAKALTLARHALQASATARVTAHQATYEAGLEAFAARRGPGRALALFLGSNIGNFDPPGREALLRAVRAALRPGDGLLMGVDLVKPRRDLLLAYDDPLGVTAAFNRNLLVRLNRELDADFALEGFAHRAIWNAAASRVEMHLVSLVRQHVRIPGAQLAFELEAGEAIWTESSYKFVPADVHTLLRRCGFEPDDQWIDPTDRFALTCARAL